MNENTQSQEGGGRRLGASAFETQEDQTIDIPIKHATTGEALGNMRLRHVKMPVIDEYRDIRNGDGRKKGNVPRARKFLFRKIFVSFVPDDPSDTLDLAQGQSELEFFLPNEKLLDRVLIDYLEQTYPDIDLKN